MASQLEKMLQDTLGDLDTLSPEKIHSLIQEALKTFLLLRDKSNSTDPKEREEAFKTAMSLKQAMQAQTEALSKKADIDPAVFAALAENQDLIPADTWLELSSAKKELEELRDQLGMTPHKPHHTTSKKHQKAVRLPG